jgi:hypothetical protein
MGVYIDAHDVLSEDDWDDLRQEAVDEIMLGRVRFPGHVLTDLSEARDALTANRHGEALVLLERAIGVIRREV